ncbi:mirror-image polydactyly gene 1 protein isoform X2 [Cololabis saira]|uniref:mirror-image polydactyly gene 1 protein isoform X2 n=1 Tax=Cololabis saira TaxID=129043 RepID=UPI002AD535DD|nr:mirror-image polydactyly gene 1 protein isoform X2 [Cololabis saira]
MKPKKFCSRSDSGETWSESPEVCANPSWDLGESLVDMYTASPRVNEELRQLLPSRTPCSSGLYRPGIIQNQQPEPRDRCPGEMEADLTPSRGSSPGVVGCRDPPDEDGATGCGGSPAPRRVQVSAGHSLQQTGTSAPLQSLDGDNNVSMLLKELDTLRELNSQLQEQLLQKERELQRREAEQEVRDEEREAGLWEGPAVLEEVLAAQKDRDQAMMSRLLLANEERDEALLRLHRLQHATEWEGISLQDLDTDVEELVQQVCEASSVQDLQQLGSALVRHLRLARQRRNDITAQEMKAVMEERDKCVVKCKRLEEDLLQVKEQQASQEELLRLRMERDTAQNDKHRMQAEIQMLQAHHSRAPQPQPSQCDAMLESVVGTQEATPPETPHLLVQLQQLSREKKSLEAELRRCQEVEREATERVRRLERLVEVLRKKVGTGSLRAVI